HRDLPSFPTRRSSDLEEGLEVERELYLGLVIDRASGCPVFMASTEGGVEIEVVAAEYPEKILKEFVNPAVGFQPFQARKLAFGRSEEHTSELQSRFDL